MDFSAAADAFERLLKESWPNVNFGNRVQRLAQSTDVPFFRRSMARLCEEVRRLHPEARFWWKDEKSHFLGACSAFVADSGLSENELFEGISDNDPRLPWTRQAVLYIRDDLKVFASQKAQLNIVERQDRPEGTVWLKTSKVPYLNRDDRTGGTLGGFEVISSQEAWRLARRNES